MAVNVFTTRRKFSSSSDSQEVTSLNAQQNKSLAVRSESELRPVASPAAGHRRVFAGAPAALGCVEAHSLGFVIPLIVKEESTPQGCQSVLPLTFWLFVLSVTTYKTKSSNQSLCHCFGNEPRTR